MATKHQFGGDWTEAKLGCLGDYLRSYRQIFAKNPKAQYFRTWYVDAFAGTGERAIKSGASTPGDLFDGVYDSEEAITYRDGSAGIALSLASPFDYYVFVEKSPGRIDELRYNIGTKHSNLLDRVTTVSGDANEALLDWSNTRDWSKDRAVVFLDPYGLQVEWETIEVLGKTRGVDLWYLFPLGLGPIRMIPREGAVPPSWSDKLDRLFGTHAWYERFFQASKQNSLFGDEPAVEREVSPDTIGAFVKERLETCFHSAAKGMILRNSKQSPMYLLCFAASNEKGAGPALRIANSILGN